MSEHADQDSQDRRLWRRYAARFRRQPAQPPLDPNALAAYLDGTAEPELVERIEARMASDGALLEEVMELRGLPSVEAGPAPESVLRQAKALVSPAARAALPPAGMVIRAQAWWRRVQWAAAAAVVVVSCLGGYGFGRDTFRAQLQVEAAAEAASDGLEELISGPDMSVNEDANGGNGGES
jgi:hypothetical protein